ncbi:MAG TPA: hypothetical protein VH165_30490 [Kofleriaceae bacterium]|jgi:hypothetical protein|nr:hypothetical protein [Kofleriaceae bacterium]
MIPYDDLVAALTSWRARQGLPVSQAAGAAPPAPPAPRPTPVAPQPAARATPTRRSAPAQVVAPDDALDDPHFEVSDDYVMPLGGEPGENTAIGAAPQASGKRNPDW